MTKEIKRYKDTAPQLKLYRRWMSYKAAKITVQDHGGITSRSKFWKWHDKVQPYFIPKNPQRVYKEWTSWNDFLGVDNTWDGYDRARKVGTWMQYWEAVRWVQKLGLKSKPEYITAYEEGRIDKNIPKAPDATYGDEWTGWKAFLGTDLGLKVESAAKVTGVLCLCTSKYTPANVLEVVVAPEGRGQLQSKLDARDDLSPYRLYVWEPHLWTQVKQIFMAMGSEREENVYIFPNVNAVTYELDNILLLFR